MKNSKEKTPQIIAILNNKQVIINVGKRDGVEVNDKFDIVDSQVKVLRDPDTHEILDKFHQKLLPRRQQDRLPFPHGRRIRRRHTFLFQAEVRAADGRRRGSRHTLALLRSERHRRLEPSQPMQ